MVYSVPPKQSKSRKRRPAHLTETKAIVSLDDRRYVLDGPTAVLGRSRECDCVLNDPNVSRRHAELRRGPTGDWQIVDLRVDQRGQGQRPPGRRLASGARRRWSCSGRSASPSTSSIENHTGGDQAERMDTEPIAVALKFGFLAVLYLFLFWVSRSALRELRRTTAPAPEATGFHADRPGRPRGGDRRLAGRRARRRAAGRRALRPLRRPLDRALGGCRRADRGPLRLRRSTRACTRAGPPTTSRTWARPTAPSSTAASCSGEAELADLDEIRIGDTELRFELQIPEGA